MAIRSSSSKAEQDEKKRKARRELRKQRGYEAKAHQQKDTQRTRGRASPKTKKRYAGKVRRYEEFLQEEKDMPEDHKVGDGHPAPTLEELKEFIRWHVESTNGRLAPNGRPTKDTTLIWAQEFVPGFYFLTGNEISPHNRAALYSWIEHDLVQEGFLSVIKRPKHTFKLSSFERAMTAFWTTDDPFFMHGRYRVQFHFITLQFLCTGARVSSFTPASAERVGRGLRYKNIELVLFRTDNAPWRVGWRLDQQFVKNNKDPENTIFGTAIWDCNEPIYSGALHLLALALADNALFGFSRPEEIFEQRIPEGEDELVLRWNDEAKDRCIVRRVTAEKVSEEPLTKERYQEGLRKILVNAGYFVTATVHAMRRELGKAVQDKYSSALVAQILTQRSKAVYGNDYLANCSGVDVFNALRGRAADHTHIDYFQGYDRFHENGLPRRLPTEEEEKIHEDPCLVAKAAEIQQAQSDDDIRRAKREYSVLKRRISSNRLQKYQSQWVQSRRDWKILTRGRERPDHIEQSAEKRVLCKLMPELGRLAAVMSSNEPLSFDEKASVVKDLFTQCLRDFDAVYRPGEEPFEKRCPVVSCRKLLEPMEKPLWSTHIHSCIQRESARNLNIPLQQIKYCWECYTFHDGKSAEFEEHCAGHLPSMTSQHYEVMVYRHTTIRAGYCIECMWDDRLPAACRMRAFDRSTELREHLEEHVDRKSWPSECADPSCNHIATEEQDYRRHLRDVHHYHKTICVRAKKACKKRLSSMQDEESNSDRDHCMQRKRPRKQRKKPSVPLSTTTKELKITFWEPPAMRLKTITSVPAQEKDKGQESLKGMAWQAVNNCQSLDLPAVSQNSQNARSATFDTPDLTDSLSGYSSPSTTGPTFGAVPINPRILETPSALLRQPVEETEQPYSCSSRVHVESNYATEKIEGNTTLQQPFADLALGRYDSQGVAVPETDNIIIEHAPLSLTSLNAKPAPSLTYHESKPIEKADCTTQSSSDMPVIEGRIKEAVGLTGPMTRAKAKEQAAKACQRSTDFQTSGQKARPYSQEEDKLLKTLMRKLATFEAVTLAFQKRFPGRSAISLRKRWSVIRPPSRRSTRLKPL
ncbi:hypothetical protein BDV27DRAFT_166718 [Aspergillus caelatus]|uniref:Uncharacterized protein n=1 Tax=Aspergillus caelatus TaxID=61420 RepID=A0A5N6ZVT3_9EURO|nr:uncharacterized protein BDV27DRAFT_166718 [Aspergillus caelatus]KAE8361714.1 hypothetical protein BDV27DRAFT_166718 [Aspergillus caelatus]